VDFQKMKIMIVEDARVVRRMAVNILKEIGFIHIIEGVDGADAIEKICQEKDIQLIISDWNMPNKSGYDLLTWLRADPTFKDIPFIMATAQGEMKQVQIAKQAGANNYIIKPFSASDLKQIIEYTLSGRAMDEVTDSATTDQMQFTESGKVKLRVAHIQITDHLVLGVLKYLISTGKFQPQFFELETQCMSGWQPVQNAIAKGDVDAAFILAPIAMDLFANQIPIKLVLLAHKDGSISVRNKMGMNNQSLKEFYKNKSFYIPHLLSIHHMLSYMFFKEIGLSPGLAGQPGANVFFEVVPPIQMPEFLSKSVDAAGYMVAEPLGTKAISQGHADIEYLSAELWEYHPCCVVAVRDHFIDQFPDVVEEFCNLLVRAGLFISLKSDTAAKIGVGFLDPGKTLGLRAPLLKKVLTEPHGIKTDDLFPVVDDLDKIQKFMTNEMKFGSIIDLNQFINLRFAEQACSVKASERHVIQTKDISSCANAIMSRYSIQTLQTSSFSSDDYIEKLYHLTDLTQTDVSIPNSLHVAYSILHKLSHTLMNLTQMNQHKLDTHQKKYVNHLKKMMYRITAMSIPQEKNGFPLSIREWTVNSCERCFSDYNRTNNGFNLILGDLGDDDYEAIYYTILFKTFFEQNRLNERAPEDYFNDINQYLLTQSHSICQFSGLYLHIDLNAMEVETASTAYPPIIFIKKRLPIPRAIGGEGESLGKTSIIDSDKHRFRVSSGDRLILHSKCVTDFSADKQSLVKMDFTILDDILLKYKDDTLTYMLRHVWQDIIDNFIEYPKNDMRMVGIEIP